MGTEELQNVTVEEPLKHQVGKLALGTIAGFIAGKLAEKAYNATLEYYRTRKNTED